MLLGDGEVGPIERRELSKARMPQERRSKIGEASIKEPARRQTNAACKKRIKFRGASWADCSIILGVQHSRCPNAL